MKTIQITLPKAVVTSIYESEKNDTPYVRFTSPAGEFSLSCQKLIHDFNKHMEDDRQDFTFEVQGRLFNNQQALQIQRVLKPSPGSKAA